MKNFSTYSLLVFTLMLSWMAGVHIQHELFTFIYLLVAGGFLVAACKDECYEMGVLFALNIIVYLLAIFSFGQFSWSSWIGG